jgi:hypothetical protein
MIEETLNYSITQLLDYPITRFPDFPISRLPDCQQFEPAGNRSAPFDRPEAQLGSTTNGTS